MVRSGGASHTLILSITYSDLSPGSGFNSLVKFMQACSSFSRFSLPHISLDWFFQEKYTLILALGLGLSGGCSLLSSSCKIEHLCYNYFGQGLSCRPSWRFHRSRSIPQGLRRTPEGLRSIPQGSRSIPEGLRRTPQGLQSLPEGYGSPRSGCGENN